MAPDQALDHPEAGLATGFEHGLQRSPTTPGAPPSHEMTHSSDRRLRTARTELDSPQREAVGAKSAPSSRGLPHSNMQIQHDAQRSPDYDGLCPQELEEHRESPDGNRPSRHRLPPTLLDENGGVH
ncbi:uncharacterized protein PHALS_14032 [Plasmopara halstedii]|uniref:Uncharacterized protein n=1 Tax=Plasmopara halstedii TaxID=4781 RepID=A0A0N7L6A6_PLAHL|nr:uncharacterized protein PHALS_14032 [Plasmopara halstedii]CEG43739.1 hypothetical protein PHALS_14032 [Plasmopara halstedii]|eukprot:XP_024580108.1 hypothetical protein PHALS_14032 [Plasmopara halstedii]